MSLRSASQNAPASARTRSRLESVLKAGIATNAGDGGSSKRANLSDESSNIAMLNEDLLLKILVKAVDDNDPCGSLEDLCLIDKEASTFCEDGRLYDEVNKKLGWYGDYSTLTALNAAGQYTPSRLFDYAKLNATFSYFHRNIFILLREKVDQPLAHEFSPQGWFMFSCHILKEFGDYRWESIKFWNWMHPTFKTLMKQSMKTYILEEIEDGTTMINYLSDTPTPEFRFPDVHPAPTPEFRFPYVHSEKVRYIFNWSSGDFDLHVNANWWFTKVVQNLKQFADVFPNEDEVHEQVVSLIDIWKEFIDFRFETREHTALHATRETEAFYEVFPEWFVKVLQELLRRASLPNISWIPADEEDDSSAKTFYGHFKNIADQDGDESPGTSDNEEEF